MPNHVPNMGDPEPEESESEESFEFEAPDNFIADSFESNFDSNDLEEEQDQSNIFQYNNWIYSFPHNIFNTPEERKHIVDVYLMPEDLEARGSSICLEVEAVIFSLERKEQAEAEIRQFRSDKNYRRADQLRTFIEKQAALSKENIAALKKVNAKFLIDDNNDDMQVLAKDFNKEELLDWVLIYLAAKGVEFPQLRLGRPEEFAGTNQHAEFVDQMKERAGEITDYIEKLRDTENLSDDHNDIA